MLTWFRKLLCSYNKHKFEDWQDAIILDNAKGLKKAHSYASQVRECVHCKFMDEKPQNGKWH